MSYTKTGPFVNGSAPGISANFLNNVETVLLAVNSAATDNKITSDGTGLLTALGLNINAAATVQNGATAGNVTLYQPFRGTHFKMIVARFTGFRNNGGHTQGVILPLAFTDRSKVWVGDLPSTGVQFQKSGVTQSIAIATSAVATGNTSSNVTTLFRHSTGEILGGWDTMIIPTGASGVTDSVLICIGW